MLGAAALALAVPVAACGSDNSDKSDSSSSSSSSKKAGKVAVLLPDSKSSVRWETVDRPFLKKAFDAARRRVRRSQNAEGDKSTQQQQAEQAITNGAKVLLLVNLDSGSGAAIAANAKSQGVKVIDYDRLTLKGDSDYYVSFDNEKVGKLQGEGLVDCLGKQARAGRSPCSTARRRTTTRRCSRRATTRCVNPKYDDGQAHEGRGPVRARLGQPEGADDLRADAAEDRRTRSTACSPPTTASATRPSRRSSSASCRRSRSPARTRRCEGIQNIVNGDQCMTVYKAIKKEADAAAKLAIALAKGETPTGVTGSINNGNKDVPAVLEEPVAVTKDNIKDYIGEAGLPQEGRDLRRQGRREVHEARALAARDK